MLSGTAFTTALARTWARARQQVQHALPSQCSLCQRWPSERICSACATLWSPAQARCQRCALPLYAGTAECGACLRAPPAFHAACAAVDYAYPWIRLLTQFKFRQDPGAAQALAQLLLRQPQAVNALAAADLVVAMPLSDERLRERGFNQAALLAQALARETGRAGQPTQWLLRPRHAAAQSGLSRRQRLANLRGAFQAAPPRGASLAGRRVVLVDDIMTTGATLEAAAQALCRAGAIHICAMVVARTPPGRGQ